MEDENPGELLGHIHTDSTSMAGLHPDGPHLSSHRSDSHVHYA